MSTYIRKEMTLFEPNLYGKVVIVFNYHAFSPQRAQKSFVFFYPLGTTQRQAVLKSPKEITE